MVAIDNSSLIKNEPDDTAVMTLFGENMAEDKWDNIWLGEFLVEPNRENSQQTRVDRFNGESGLLDIEMPQRAFALPFLPQPRETFDVKQKWEGYVLEVGEDTFLARLVPLIGEGGEVEAEIYLEEIDREDHCLVTPGAVFYWNIGYLKKPSGTYRTSLIRFRRLPPIGANELNAARVQARQLLTLLDDESAFYSPAP